MSAGGQETAVSPERDFSDERIADSLMYCAGFLRHHTEGRGSRRKVLQFLHERGPMTQRDILEVMGVRASSLSELLGKLEARGYVKKERSGEDRRNYNVSITSDGMQALKEMQAQYESTRTGLLSGLDREEKAQLAALLEKLQGLWSARAEEAPSGASSHGRRHGRRSD